MTGPGWQHIGGSLRDPRASRWRLPRTPQLTPESPGQQWPRHRTLTSRGPRQGLQALPHQPLPQVPGPAHLGTWCNCGVAGPGAEGPERSCCSPSKAEVPSPGAGGLPLRSPPRAQQAAPPVTPLSPSCCLQAVSGPISAPGRGFRKRVAVASGFRRLSGRGSTGCPRVTTGGGRLPGLSSWASVGPAVP